MGRASGLTVRVRRGERHGDDLYAALMEAHEGLTPDESAALNARLVLILMNAVGDAAAIREAIAQARCDQRVSRGDST